MPKKHQKRVLFLKPQSSSPHTLSLSKSQASKPENSDTPRTVNDLIRESRRQQLRNGTRSDTAANASSVHPSVRAVLDLPTPPAPAPRPRFGPRAAGGELGPSLLWHIPGPPPPQSWLTGRRGTSTISSYPVALTTDPDIGNGRIQVRSSNLPNGAFPSVTSLQHLVLKSIACNWEWHAENDGDYFVDLPILLRENLLSYIAVYSETVRSNPLKILFLDETDTEDKAQVTRLDLSNAVGTWTTLKQLERNLLVKNAGTTSIKKTAENRTFTMDPTPDSWDTDANGEHATDTPTITPLPRTIHNFKNLRHLSLAVSPYNFKAASWSSLLALTAELGTLTSLSLAHWPQPTLTPNAAFTRALINRPDFASAVYDGSDIHTSLDDDWREAAGMLRTLSRSLYCLKWLDLTGCGDWFAALEWKSPLAVSFFSLPSLSPPGEETAGPEWNSGWRGLETLILEVGWRPVRPSAIGHGTPAKDEDIEAERRLYRYKKERERFDRIRSTAQSVARHLRSVRKAAGGKWIEVKVSDELVGLSERDGRMVEI
ncbi:hypothetical protein AYO21_01225 [Fonsecaea monophora]|uniref:Tafazzin n=1 Tax=Fonsecaea monophora TaxID=254056 RepID=A0A177FKK5_9EURO|nr:hypothetical protein AYO21_01225 [Fonsecaea monophora]OAG44735.1 hypothetical protein AYO21_01225 [Fonsecaea monophora]